MFENGKAPNVPPINVLKLNSFGRKSSSAMYPSPLTFVSAPGCKYCPFIVPGLN